MEKTRQKPPSLKQQAIEAISKMQDSADMDEIMYELYVIDKICKGRKDAREGRTTSTDDLAHEIEKW